MVPFPWWWPSHPQKSRGCSESMNSIIRCWVYSFLLVSVNCSFFCPVWLQIINHSDSRFIYQFRESAAAKKKRRWAVLVLTFRYIWYPCRPASLNAPQKNGVAEHIQSILNRRFFHVFFILFLLFLYLLFRPFTTRLYLLPAAGSPFFIEIKWWCGWRCCWNM